MTPKLQPLPRTWADFDDAPELTAEWAKSAELQYGDKVIRRGRPAGHSKTATTVRFDNEILAAFRATGPRWQTRMNAVLADWLKHHSPDEVSV